MSREEKIYACVARAFRKINVINMQVIDNAEYSYTVISLLLNNGNNEISGNYIYEFSQSNKSTVKVERAFKNTNKILKRKGLLYE